MSGQNLICPLIFALFGKYFCFFIYFFKKYLYMLVIECYNSYI